MRLHLGACGLALIAACHGHQATAAEPSLATATATAPGLAPELALAPASAAPAPPPFVFAAEVPVAAQVLIWPAGLSSGRNEPLFHNFMAQVRFSGEPAVLTCALRLAEPESQVLPGEQTELALRCLLPFRVAPGQPEFKLYAGPRPIGQGKLGGAALKQVMGEAAAGP